MKASEKQVGGNHYKNMQIGPTVFCQVNGLNACESQIINYLVRHHQKGGIQDLRKAKHLIDMIAELEYPHETTAEKHHVENDYGEFCDDLLKDIAESLGVSADTMDTKRTRQDTLDWVSPAYTTAKRFRADQTAVIVAAGGLDITPAELARALNATMAD